jgi:separase
LAELEGSRTDTQSTNDEHLFLVLDKNVQSFPWESIPILRGRAVSRIPSLPFLLDQVALVGELQASATAAAPALMLGAAPTSQLTSSIPARESRSVKPSEPPAMLAVGTSASASTAIPASSTSSDLRLSLDSRKVFYILNPSGDLSRTQTHFEPWLASMISKAGWKGISGRPPTELELTSALREYDLVLYFGHGGAEQYIRSHKVRHLTRCATTMLWGCSSGHLKDQGDLDRTGTAWNYMMAGW